MLHYIGIDVSKKKLDCTWLKDPVQSKFKSKVFANTPRGHDDLLSWLSQQVSDDLKSIVITVEPTGIYHERLIYELNDQSIEILLVNPGKAKLFADSQNLRNKTDKKDSAMLARYGFSSHKTLKSWHPEKPEVRELKLLIRRLDMLEGDLQKEKNRLEASAFSDASERVQQSIREMIETLSVKVKELKREIDDHIDAYPELKRDRKLLTSIIGVGEVVSREMVYLLHSKDFCNGRQVSAFVGLTPKHRESGQWRGRTRISKQGPSRIRAKLYMAAVVCCQHNPSIRSQYQRLLANGKTSMQAVCAAMRKLVEICFAVLKHQNEYRPEFCENNT